MSKVVDCRMLTPVGVVLDVGNGEFQTVPTLYDHKIDEVFVIHHHPDVNEEDIVASVKEFIHKRNNTLIRGSLSADIVDPEIWGQIRILTGLAKPPEQEK